MLISDSISVLWLIYLLLSLIVLATGYMAIRFLPLLPRLIVTGAVAGVIWMPIRFHMPLVEEGEFYTGLAPAILVAAVSFLQRDGMLSGAVALLLVGASLGTAAGVGLWWLFRRRHDEDDTPQRGERPRGGDQATKRREPVIG